MADVTQNSQGTGIGAGTNANAGTAAVGAAIGATAAGAAMGAAAVGAAIGAASGATAAGAAIDKNKTPEQYITEAENKYIVPALVREKFPDLIKLIYETESMNEEEREYWLQIMPIMSEDQISKFRDILVNERDQLSKLDQEYQQEMNRINASKPAAEIDEKAMQEKLQNIKTAEAQSKQEEKGKEDVLLEQLKNL